ncbi:MAG: 1,4-alpha-glucan branching protein GlgB [Puniceicoccaceae bacterium]
MLTSKTDLDLILKARHHEPHSLLGMHPSKGRKAGVELRAFLRETVACEVVCLDSKGMEASRHELKLIDPSGFYEGTLEGIKSVCPYRLRATLTNGEIRQFYDPYSFLPTIGEQELYLFNEGNEHFIYRKLGAHLRTINGISGVSFAVWAPGAKRVSVVGDFNRWDGRYHPMRSLGSSGVWEIFIPGLGEGTVYKYELIGGDSQLRLKTDPYGTRFESPPHNASIVCSLDGYQWGDQAWIEERAKTDLKKKPVSIYEVHLGSWRRAVEDGNRSLSYREAAVELADYVVEQGFTHVEFMPLAEHPFDGSWGYQVTGFFAPTHRFGPPEDFQYLVDQLHQRKIGVIIDWVPGHFPTDAFALAQFDGTHLYEHADPRQGMHMDWGTLIFNYGRHEVRCFLVASALSWFDRYHIDGVRVDAVASMLYLDYSRKEGEWIPNAYGGRENIEAIEFMRQVNDLVHHYYPGAVTIAEESTSFGGVSKPTSEYGLGFDFKWNMGWMHDSLSYFSKDPIHRKYHHDELTFGMLYQYSENFVMVYSHDEVVHGKGSMLMKMGSWSITEKAQTLRALYAYMWGWPGKKTLFMGSEFGQSEEWKYDGGLQWHLLQYLDHDGVRLCLRDLNHFYLNEPCLGEFDLDPQGFEWVNCTDGDASCISFLRKSADGDQVFLVISNFTPVDRETYRVGVPCPGFWKECINTNALEYGGRGHGNGGGLMADEIGNDGRDYSLMTYLPGNSTIIFKHLG